MQLIIFLISILFSFQSLSAEEKPKPCTFFIMESIQTGNSAEISNGTLIEIRGFLYESADKSMILAAEPNLKSCCVGAVVKRQKQLLVSGDVHSEAISERPVMLHGNLLIDLNDSFPFKLQHATIVVETKQTYGLLLFVGAMITLVLIIFAYFWKRQKNN